MPKTALITERNSKGQFILGHKMPKKGGTWKQRNPERKKTSDKQYREKYPKSSSEWQNKRVVQVYQYLGNKCSKCGFDKIPALQIHHNDNIKKDRRDWFNVHYDLDNLKLLCANCHCLLHYKNKYGKDWK